ncbi:oligopeptide transporter subunit; membrane component of ABC superfamily [Methylacidimicrobium sp. AP8]|uniref:ABC transporter permease n=1 Tax=Methylacidimicrobium sp. AP8 TaxID=2730359 RepID=UPI0018C12615|nr:ABC transporter permease [Methylacidimicrobium sp. AP8]CAB4243475.1 oligopeptide transporter subunit; membrane component of ABC superfamily [Methylacidimicrobium sp. AP8]
MVIFLIRRLIRAIPVLLGVITITFFLVRLAPGSPFAGERAIPPAILRELESRYKLNGSLWEQYTSYVSDVLHGDLRLSTRYRNRTVGEIIGQTLPVSLTLGGSAFCVALGFGIAAGVWAAVRHNRTADRFIQLLCMGAISIPSFVLAPLAVLLLSLQWKLLPSGGWGSFRELLLPAICLALPYAAVVARLTRASMLEILPMDYIRTARAKGLTPAAVLFVHALKPASLPIIAYAGPLAANLLTGSLVIEEIFGIQGMGSFFVEGVLSRDVFLVAGVTLVYSTLLIGFNLLADLVSAWLDKRVQLS